MEEMMKETLVNFKKHYPDLHGIIVSWIGEDYKLYIEYDMENMQNLSQFKRDIIVSPYRQMKEEWKRSGPGMPSRKISLVDSITDQGKFELIIIDVQGAFTGYVI